MGTQLYYPNDPAKYGADAGTPIAYQGVMNQINPTYEDPVAKAWIAGDAQPDDRWRDQQLLHSESRTGFADQAARTCTSARTDLNMGSKDHLYYTYWWQYSGLNTATNLPVAYFNRWSGEPRERAHSTPELGTYLL